MRVLVARGRISLLLVQGRGRRLPLHTSFRTRARIGHLVRPGRRCVISIDSLGIDELKSHLFLVHFSV